MSYTRWRAAPAARFLFFKASPMTASRPSDQHLLELVARGDRDAAEELYHRYADRVWGLAEGRISGRIAARVAVEDIVQSVFRRFFAGALAGRYELPSGSELWGMLLVITLNRLRTEEKYQRADRRDVRRTVSWDPLERGEPAAKSGGDVDAALTAAVLDAVDHLPERYRDPVRLRIEGHEVAEIAAKLGRSLRTVERLLQGARERLKGLTGPEDGA